MEGKLEEKSKRDYKAEYKKYGSSTKAKKYRAELNKYNRQKGTYGNGDKKDASHKGGKIVGFEEQSKNRGRAEKSRLKKEGKLTEGISVADERHVGKFLIVILSSGSEMRSAILSKKNADKYNRNDKNVLKTLWNLAGKYKGKEIKEGKLTEGKYDKILDKIEDLVKGAKNFMDVGKVLKKAGIKYIFSTNMIPMYKLKKFPIAILNKKYVDKSDRTVGDIAIGVLGEGKLKEYRIRGNADELVISKGDIKKGMMVWFEYGTSTAKKLKVKHVMLSKDKKEEHYVTNKGTFTPKDVVGY